MRGKFITLDGVEAAGKTTQIAYIENWLKAEKIPYLMTREPGGTPLGEQLRGLLLDSALAIEEGSELLLVLAARYQHLRQVIMPALAEGKWVVSDRYNDATYAYQGAGRGIALEKIAAIESVLQVGLEPDLRLILTLPLAQAQERLAKRRQDKDRFEQNAHDFFARVHAAYLARAQLKGAYAIDASLTEAQVFAQIRVALEALR